MTGRTNAVPDGGQDRPRLTYAPALTSDLTRRDEGGAGVMAGAPGTGRRGGAAGRVPVLLSDPRVSAVPVRDVGEPLIGLDESFGPSRAQVRVSVARQLVRARERLPQGLALRVVEGYRTAAAQRAIIEAYTAQLRAACPGVSPADLDHLTSRFVAPPAVAPHVAGAAVDVTLVDSTGCELDLGTPVDATPEQSDGACFFDAPQVTGQARAHRELLARVLGGAGLVNYDRVVALELRRPVLGADNRGSRSAIRPGRRGSDSPMSAVAAPAAARSGCAQGPVLTVDLPAVAANTRLFTSRTRAEVMAVVKADGSGTAPWRWPVPRWRTGRPGWG
jgi:D-alanyl-D-alanine dipeptidase